MDALRNTIALQQKTSAELVDQMKSTGEATQSCSGCYPSQTGSGPVPQTQDYGYQAKPTTTTTTTTTSTTTTDQPSKDTRFADAVKRRPTHQQLVERQPDFRKAGAAAWLALKRETSVPAHSAPKVELSSGLRLIYASGFPYAKPGDLRKAMQGARIRTSASGRDYRQVLQSLDSSSRSSRQGQARCYFVVLLQRRSRPSNAVLTSKPGTSFRSLLASIGGKTLEAATAEATKIRVQTPDFSISTLETVPKESLPVKKATDKEPAAPAVDPPSDMAAEVTPATQDDGVAPTVTPIADVEMCL
ncbi:hypothetical protein BASA61_005727 [Batrachochytrium salamandrivorans]|nr:hypothetical protein BASA61_005727 [Batrachochytrium salamandrivorans]